MKPLFSIFIIASNSEAGLEDSRASLLGQSLPPENLEIGPVLVRETESIDDELLAEALARSRGDYLGFLHGGDRLRCDALESVKNLLGGSRPDLIRFGLKILDHWGEQIGPAVSPRPGGLFSAGRLPAFLRRSFLEGRYLAPHDGSQAKGSVLEAEMLERVVETLDIAEPLYLRKAEPDPNGPPIAEEASGAVVLMPNVDYAARHLARVGRSLQSLGHKILLTDLAPNFSFKRRLADQEAAAMADLNYRALYLDLDEVFFPSARAYVLSADWSAFRPLIFKLRERGIPTIGFYEGIHDDWLSEPADPPFKNDLHYRHTDYLLIPGEYYRDIYGRQRTFVAGLPEIGALLGEEPVFSEPPLILINVNFSYGVLENRRDLFVSTAVEACRRLGLPFVISQHPADLGDLGGLPVSSDTVYNELRRCTALISRFSTCIIEALALGKAAIYHNPHGERFPKFKDDPMGAFESSASADELVRALEKVLRERRERLDVRARARAWLRRHANLFASEPPEVLAAEAIGKILQSHEPAFQRRLIHLAARPEYYPPAPGPDRPEPPAAAVPEEDPRPGSAEELRERLDWALAGGRPRLALDWLNEYELRHGRDGWAVEREQVLDRWRREDCARPSLFPPAPVRALVPDLTELKDLFAGQRAFVAGSGPSLRRMRPGPLKKEITLGVNGVFMMGLTPAFHLADEKRVAMDLPGAARLALLSGPVKICGPELGPWLGEDGETIFPHILTDSGVREPYFSTDASVRLWGGGFTPYLALQLAYYLGFSEIYLIGFDHTLPPGPGLEAAEAGLRRAKRAFELAGRRIFNATDGGRLEVFERVKFEDIFEKGRPARVGDRPGVDWLADWRRAGREVLAGRRRRAAKPEVAVVVPVYNVAPYVQKALTSIMNQTFEDLEIIVVDQSDDAGTEIIQKLAEADPRIRILRQEEKSPGLARNRGLAASSAPWITFVDADDFIEPDMVESLWAKAIKKNLDLANGFLAVNEDGQSRYEEYNLGDYQSPEAAVRALLRCEHSGVAWARLYRRKLFSQTGLLFPDGLYEDLALVYRLYLAAGRVGTVPRPLYHWRWRPGSRTMSMSRAHLIDLMTVIGARHDLLRSNPDLWNAYRADYYLGLWTMLKWLTKGMGGRPELLRELRAEIRRKNIDGRRLPDFVRDRRTIDLAASVWSELMEEVL